jgi:predicted anti-sigma-YlaC factor YlaD
MFLCNFVEKNMASYANGKVNLLTTVLMKQHLGSCSSCRGKLKSDYGIQFAEPPDMKAVKKQVGEQEDAATVRSRAEANKMVSKSHK